MDLGFPQPGVIARLQELQQDYTKLEIVAAGLKQTSGGGGKPEPSSHHLQILMICMQHKSRFGSATALCSVTDCVQQG